jgi:predicted nucleic acid-binding protein
MAFWDTSALLKLYVRERDSDRFHHLIQNLPEKTAISQFTLAEMHRALWAKVFARAVPVNFAQKAYREFRADIEAAILDVVPFGVAVQEEFDRIIPICNRASSPVPIRTLDGFILASALIARTVRLVTTDSRMRAAGTLLGLHVLPESFR